MTQTPEQKKANLRMGLVLVSIAAVFLVGFMLKMIVLGR
ncbi:MAG: cytochrome oxidase small assembly protein [Rhodoferax sp.]|nr:cytochrome oxidase small assembly protein [Rhodoferax sp.]